MLGQPMCRMQCTPTYSFCCVGGSSQVSLAMQAYEIHPSLACLQCSRDRQQIVLDISGSNQSGATPQCKSFRAHLTHQFLMLVTCQQPTPSLCTPCCLPSSVPALKATLSNRCTKVLTNDWHSVMFRLATAKTPACTLPCSVQLICKAPRPCTCTSSKPGRSPRAAQIAAAQQPLRIAATAAHATPACCIPPMQAAQLCDRGAHPGSMHHSACTAPCAAHMGYFECTCGAWRAASLYGAAAHSHHTARVRSCVELLSLEVPSSRAACRRRRRARSSSFSTAASCSA